jgi:hypothetical protein
VAILKGGQSHLRSPRTEKRFLRSWNRASLMYSSIINKMQRYTMVFIAINALHVLGGSSAHHQELNTVKHSTGYLSSFFCFLPLSWVSSNSFSCHRDLYLHSQKTDIHTPGRIRNRNPSKRAGAGPYLRTRGHRDRHTRVIMLTANKLASRRWSDNRLQYNTLTAYENRNIQIAR